MAVSPSPENNLRIVIADDDALILLDISGALEQGGFEVVGRARNGEELVEQCLRLSPDLIITDVRMPKKDGISAVKEIFKNQRIPVIFITAYSREDIARHFRNVVCLSKPFDEITLQSAIKEALRQHSR